MKAPPVKPGRVQAPKRCVRMRSTMKSSEALEPRLVELARMARQRPAVREHHRPGHVGGRPHSSPLMKLAIRPKKSPNVHRGGADVEQRQHRDLPPEREDRHGEDGADEAAVERHAAFPEPEEAERVVEEVAGLVEDARSRSARRGRCRRPARAGSRRYRRASAAPAARPTAARSRPAGVHTASR